MELTSICADKKNPMSKDVEQILIEVISSQRNVSVEQAIEILDELENEGRFLKDVY